MPGWGNGRLRQQSSSDHHHEAYTNLKALGILGLIEMVLGLASLCVEIAGFAFFYELQIPHDKENSKLPYLLEIAGILIALNTMFTGLFGFLTKLELIKPRARHCMFLLGMLLTLISGSEAFTMLMLSMQKATSAYQLYKKNPRSVYDDSTRIRTTPDSKLLNAPHEPFREEQFIMYFLRSMAAILYFLLGFLFLASFLLNSRNIRHIQKRGHGFFPDFRTTRDGKRLFSLRKRTRLSLLMTPRTATSWLCWTDTDHHGC